MPFYVSQLHQQCKCLFFFSLILLSHRILSEKGSRLSANVCDVCVCDDRAASYNVVEEKFFCWFCFKEFADKEERKFWQRFTKEKMMILLCLWNTLDWNKFTQWGISKTCSIYFIESERHFLACEIYFDIYFESSSLTRVVENERHIFFFFSFSFSLTRFDEILRIFWSRPMLMP